MQTDSHSTIALLPEYKLLSDLEQSEEKPESYLSMMWKTSKRAIKMLLCFTYSAELPILLAIMGRLPTDSEGNTKSLAAATLTINVWDTAVLIPGVISFAMMLEGGEIYGQMMKAESSEEKKRPVKKILNVS